MAKATKAAAMRDETTTLADYEATIDSETRRLENEQAHEIFVHAPVRCLRIALATYSTGGKPADCLKWIDRGCDYKLRFFAKKNFAFPGYGQLLEDFEFLPTSSLVGRADEMIDGFRRCRFEKDPVPRVRGLINQLSAVLKGEPVVETKPETDDLKKNGKPLLTLPPVLRAVSKHDAAAFAKSLGEYLVKSRARDVKQLARLPFYVGRWSMFAAGMCSVFGGIPALPAAARQYVPIELVEYALKRTK